MTKTLPGTRRRAAWARGALVLLALLLAVAGACAKKTASDGQYYCPMHPTYVADKPGDCPICNMRLVPREDAPRAAAKAEPAGGTRQAPAAEYSCPMHPSYVSDRPGGCPICNMRLVPQPEVAQRDSMQPSALPGMASVSVDAQARALAGLRTEVASREQLVRSVRTVGTVMLDETRVRHVHTKIAGYVERLFVNSTGQFVRRGEPALAIYSPELLATQEEFLRARDAALRFATSAIPEVRRGGEDLLLAARRRLELFDVPQSFIAELEASGEPQRTVVLDAPTSGYVTTKGVLEGHRVQPGLELFTIADLSHVWIEADFYENEARLVRAGQPAELTLSFDPETRLHGRASYVYPYLDAETRTLKVRFEFANPDLVLKPGMFADVWLNVDAPPAVVVPESAILDSGLRQVVFVETAPNTFEPRAVRVGVRTGGKAEILAGVAEGEHVVVRANFLLDSESKLRGALSGMGGAHQHGGEKP